MSEQNRIGFRDIIGGVIIWFGPTTAAGFHAYHTQELGWAILGVMYIINLGVMIGKFQIMEAVLKSWITGTIAGQSAQIIKNLKGDDKSPEG
jgi:hypothetical protein